MIPRLLTLCIGLVLMLGSTRLSAQTGSTGNSASDKAAQVVSLEHSLLPLRVHFNMHADQIRVVALVSPT